MKAGMVYKIILQISQTLVLKGQVFTTQLQTIREILRAKRVEI